MNIWFDKKYLSGLSIKGLFFCRETTWTPVLTRISEKTDFSPALASKPADRTPSIPAQQQIDD